MKGLYKKLLVLVLTASPATLLAAVTETPGLRVPTTGVRRLEDITDIIVTVINWLMGLFFAVAVLFIFYAAYLYLTAAGEPEKLTKAKNQLIYSIIAIVVALLAGSIRFVVGTLLGAQ